MLKVCLISLGCPKNLIDSEVMAGRIAEERMEMVYDPGDADVAVVNTCGFIRDAVDESVETLVDLCRLKEAGVLQGVVAAPNGSFSPGEGMIIVMRKKL